MACITLYAMVDRDDDLKIGIKSTAILFGRYDKLDRRRCCGSRRCCCWCGSVIWRSPAETFYWSLLLAGALFFTSRNRSPAASARPASRPSCRTTMWGWWCSSASR
ncbi:hypothetical protein M8494_29325 [Serratia ureilytica]